MFVDSHCHLNYAGVSERQSEVLAAARARGVHAMLNISTRQREWMDVVATAEREPDVWAAIGVHPHEADEHAHVTVDQLVAATDHPRVIGVGESGLDFHYDHSDRDQQRASFQRHIAAARITGLPLIIHTRAAEDDTVSILEEELGRGSFPALLHCFTGSHALAEKALNLGLMLSFSGIVTFKNAKDLQAVAAGVPEDRLLIETDAPFLAPVPHRGQPCEPAFVADTCAFLARLRGTSIEALAEASAANFVRLFTKARL